jgi:hypothetical protein
MGLVARALRSGNHGLEICSCYGALREVRILPRDSPIEPWWRRPRRNINSEE